MKVSRRSFLAGVVATGAITGTAAIAANKSTPKSETKDLTHNLYGLNQSGIQTPAQEYLYFLSFDLTTESKARVQDLFKRWTNLASQLMTDGVVADGQSYNLPPKDTGEILGAEATGLTITFGFGPSLFNTNSGKDRYGFANKKPIELKDLPKLPKDSIKADQSYGDVCIQICGNNPIVLFHAGRNLTREAFGTASLRWAQQGFSGAVPSKEKMTPRNLFGFKDGTANPLSDADFAESVWIDSASEPAFMQGGTYLAVRRIKMIIETWDRTSLREQEGIIGRSRVEGAPLSGGKEFTVPDFKLKDSTGTELIPKDSHLAIAHSSNFSNKKMLRRGYNFENGMDKVGHLDAGLLFLSFQKSLESNFIPVLQALSKSDALNEYILHTGTAVFAIPRAPKDSSEFIGFELFI